MLVTHRWGGGVFTYRRPRFVESKSMRVPLYDMVGVARVTALGAVLATTLLRRFKR